VTTIEVPEGWTLGLGANVPQGAWWTDDAIVAAAANGGTVTPKVKGPSRRPNPSAAVLWRMPPDPLVTIEVKQSTVDTFVRIKTGGGYAFQDVVNACRKAKGNQ
jgi:hypothetical protein